LARADFTLDPLISFDGTQGASPSAPLLQGADGNLYGSTESGGSGSTRGTVFRVSPGGTLTTLLQFTSPYANGADPQSGLVQGPSGEFYGTTAAGGANGQGTVFKLTAAGVASPLYSFVGTYDGGQPHAALVRAGDGNFYGTTAGGGFYFNGTVFQVTTNDAFNPLYSFSGPDGVYPYGGLLVGPDGNLYGTTEYGGAGYDGTDYSGAGTVFQITLDGSLNTWVYFGGNNGAVPAAGLVQGADGNFYGATSEGGTNGNHGSVFKLNTNGTLSTLFSFDGTNGASPVGNLVQDTDGSFYGTTAAGGLGYNGSSTSGYGTVFRVTTNGALTTLFSFNGTDGSMPLAGLCPGTNGCFYGTTSAGGAYDLGTLFQLSFIPLFTAITRNGGTVHLTWSATAGHVYQPQFRVDLTQGGWNNLSNPLTATNATASASDGLPPDHQRFYRVRLVR
jgi:uncharacterized repeat protein (TIGR03803 family)